VSVALPPELDRLLQASTPGNRDEAWAAFVACHNRLLLHAARAVCHEYDGAMDAYAHLLEALRADDARRLRAYRPIPGSKFTTWLVMVARRLCVDHVRHRYGQPRSHRPGSDAARRARIRLVDLVAEDFDPDRLPAGSQEDPDVALRHRELERALAEVRAELDSRDRLLLTLRFEDGLTAAEIAEVMRFPSLFHVYRRLRTVTTGLGEALRRRGIVDGKP